LVAGKTVEQIEEEVQAAVKAKTPDAGPINVRLIGRQSKVYYVLGQVNAPGSFPLQGRETVLDGIVAAGGLNIRASRSNIILSRPTAPDGCRVVLPVCYRQIVQLGDTTTNYQLQPGDRIYVPGQTLCESICSELFPSCESAPCNGPQFPCFGAGCQKVTGPVAEPAPAVLPNPQ
jgi:protein involved in polysaccharide export with SLBB domain